MTYRAIDTHTHLNLAAFNDDRAETLARTNAARVAHINVGTNEDTSQRAVAIAEKNAGAWAIIGLHPLGAVPGLPDHETIGTAGAAPVSKAEVFNPDFYHALARSVKVVGIGECGFDYYHPAKDSYPVQEEAFLAQIELANELNLPLMIHTRDPKPGADSPTGNSAYADVHRLLKAHARVSGNVHFYAGNYEQAKLFFDIGFTVSFTGVITFAPVYEEVVKAVPLTLMHAETDAPYVAPVPYRGKRNEPAYVLEVTKKIAALKNLPLPEVEEQLLQNAERLYKIKLH